eukprot:281991-Prorocentrum_minimum.AAC.1
MDRLAFGLDVHHTLAGCRCEHQFVGGTQQGDKRLDRYRSSRVRSCTHCYCAGTREGSRLPRAHRRPEQWLEL